MSLPRKSQRDRFIQAVWQRYQEAGRHDLPWRKTRNAYRILVSEVMLQQTQVERVRGYWTAFLKRFPDPAALAASSPGDVIAAWQGLGYNRRALALRLAMQEVVERHGGKIPRERDALLALPGIGPYTADAVRAFAWDEPGTLLETNVRTALIHHFFKDSESVSDRELAEVLSSVQDDARPREFWWALMDYGAHLKATVGNLSRKSVVYARQKPFAGSDRQLRGRIIRLLLQGPRSLAKMRESLGDDERLERILGALTAEGFLMYDRKRYDLAR